MEQIGIIVVCILVYLVGCIIAGVMFTYGTKQKVTTILESGNDNDNFFMGVFLLLSWISILLIFIVSGIYLIFRFIVMIISKIENILDRKSKWF